MDSGKVAAVDEKYAYIAMKLNSGCKSCSSKALCFSGDKPVPLKVKNSHGLQVGDLVEIELSSHTKLSAGFLLFLFPLILLIVGYLLGSMINNSESYGMIGAGIGFGISIMILMFFNRFAEKRDVFKPLHIKKIP